MYAVEKIIKKKIDPSSGIDYVIYRINFISGQMDWLSFKSINLGT